MQHEYLFKCMFGEITKNIRVLSVLTDETEVKNLFLAYLKKTSGIVPEHAERILPWSEMADELIRL